MVIKVSILVVHTTKTPALTALIEQCFRKGGFAGVYMGEDT
jgi:hypothetical protein